MKIDPRDPTGGLMRKFDRILLELKIVIWGGSIAIGAVVLFILAATANQYFCLGLPLGRLMLSPIC